MRRKRRTSSTSTTLMTSRLRASSVFKSRARMRSI
jgi:hypothetical protein